MAFDGRTITWSTTHPDYPRIFWDRREPTLMESVPRELPEDWEPPATVRMGTGGLEEVPREEESLLMRGEHVAHMLRTRSPRALALATQSHLDFDAVRAAENAIRAPTELRFGSPPPPPPRAGDETAAQMARRFDLARRFDRARALSEAEREELWSEADRRSDELERQAEEANRRFLAEAERRGRAAGRRTVSTAPVYTEERYAAVQLEGTTRDERVQSLWRVLRANARRREPPPPRAGDDGDAAAEVLAMARDAVLSDAEREEQIRELRAEARRATAQSEIEENARRWLETAGDDAAARASAFAAGGYLDPSDFTAVASSSDSESSEASSDSDASDTERRLKVRTRAQKTEPRVEVHARKVRRHCLPVLGAQRHRRGSSMARRVSARRPRDFSVSAAARSKASPCSERAVILASWALFRASAPPRARSTRSFSSSKGVRYSHHSRPCRRSVGRGVCASCAAKRAAPARVLPSQALGGHDGECGPGSGDAGGCWGVTFSGSLRRREAASSIVGGHEIDQCRAFSGGEQRFTPRCPICFESR